MKHTLNKIKSSSTKYYVKNIAFIKINIYSNGSPFQGINILHKWIFSFIQVFSFLDVQFSSEAAFVIWLIHNSPSVAVQIYLLHVYSIAVVSQLLGNLDSCVVTWQNGHVENLEYNIQKMRHVPNIILLHHIEIHVLNFAALDLYDFHKSNDAD